MRMFTWIINIFKGKKSKNQVTIQNGNEMVELQKPVVEDPRKIILKDSKDRLNKLSIYMNYFTHKKITDIFNQTEIIHNVFDENTNLTYKKLEQYHYYYTDNLIELLDKLKKSTDEKISILITQIKTLNNKIGTSKTALTQSKDSNISNLTSQYNNYMSLQLSCIFNQLIEGFNDFRYKKPHDFKFYNYLIDDMLFWNMPVDTYLELIKIDEKKCYQWEDYIIEKLLLGKLQKNVFLIEMIGCFNISDKNYLELFKITNSGDYFVYDPKQFIFKLIKLTDIHELMNDDNTKYALFKDEIKELNDQKIRLEANLNNIKKSVIDTEVKVVLDKYLVKIEDIELLDKITEINVETKNLEVLLELERLDI